jgi:hypothetical protein
MPFPVNSPAQVVAVLEQPAPPAPSHACGYCAYLAAGQRVGV